MEATGPNRPMPVALARDQAEEGAEGLRRNINSTMVHRRSSTMDMLTAMATTAGTTTTLDTDKTIMTLMGIVNPLEGTLIHNASTLTTMVPMAGEVGNHLLDLTTVAHINPVGGEACCLGRDRALGPDQGLIGVAEVAHRSRLATMSPIVSFHIFAV